MIKRKNDIVTIGSAFEMYNMERRAKGCVRDTIANSEFMMKVFLEDNDLSLNDPIQSIDKYTIIEWSNFMQKTELSPESINAYLSRMRGFVNWCINNDYLPYFKVNLLKVQEQKIKFFTEEELEILCKKPSNDCDFVEYRTWVIICFILATGARASTVVNIKKEDINFQEKYVTYTHLKNKSLANIPLSNSIINILNNYMRTWDFDSEYLFTDMYSNNLTVSALRQALIKYCKRRNITPRGPHSLRHSFSRQWIKAGGGTFQLQKMLTHSDLTMTRHYVNLFSEDLKNDVEEYSPLESFIKTNKKIKRA